MRTHGACARGARVRLTVVVDAGAAHACTRRAGTALTSASAAPATTVSGSSPAMQPGREVEPDLRLALALLGGAARASRRETVQPSTADAADERDERDEVVALLDVEAVAWAR